VTAQVPKLGFWFIHRTPLYEEPRATRVVQLLTDQRWPWQPNVIRPTQFPGRALYPWKGGKTARTALPTAIGDVLRSELTEGICVVTSRVDTTNHAWFDINSGRAALRHEGMAYPFDAIGMCRVSVPTGESIDDWLAVMRELAESIQIGHGIISAEADERWMRVRIFLSGGLPQPRMPQDFPANETTRILNVRREMGERYVRPPAWATFLRRAHVDAVGGRDHLLATVQPPVVHDCGDLLYIQLSASVDDALAPETEARRRTFADLLAPITVPPLVF
jgi:hypothetical protein